jgi:hypothetical protein
MKKIAVICPVHRRPDLLDFQLENYKKFSNDGCVHFLHKSIEGGSNFSSDVLVSLSSKHNIFFSPYSTGTSWKTCIGALIVCTELINTNLYDYVYMHTDGDLIINGDLQKYIYRHGLGYSGIFMAGFEAWPHYKIVKNDQRFLSLLNSLDLTFEDVIFGRQEGAFFPINIWLKIIGNISKFYDESFFNNSSLHWPLEEVVIPTLAKKFTDDAHHVLNIIRTKEPIHPDGRDNPLNCVNASDISNLTARFSSDECVGLKWFSQDLLDPARLILG